MSERKHADLWKELVDEAGEDETERAANESVAQAEAELKGAGFDIAAERAKAGAFAGALGSGGSTSTSKEAAPRAPEAPRRKGPRAAAVWLAAAATVAVAVGAMHATLHPRPAPVAHPPPMPSSSAPVAASPDALAVAAELRRKAAAACDAKQWIACLAELDGARAVDPDGDAASTVKSLREKAMAALGR